MPRFLISLFCTIALVVFLNTKIGDLISLGKFFDPFNGFWQNAETNVPSFQKDYSLEGLQGKAEVYFDKRMVPHVFADNTHDLYFLQGFITAQHRLWQMDFQTYAAAGRLSEIIGEKGLNYDRIQRRMGLFAAAKKNVEAFEHDSISHLVMQSYADGVNAFIATLTKKNLPLEYKMLDYEPEPWTPLKSALLLKYMAKMLTGTERDFENTNALKLLGRKNFDLLFPEYADSADAVIPQLWDYKSQAKGSGLQILTSRALPTLLDRNCNSRLDRICNPVRFSKGFAIPSENTNDLIVGSNNWAVSGAKTVSGNAILCNDPHLQLQLPSIWYEMQLAAPGLDVYGVTLPGSPNVIIGFNDSITWGVTNASVDVKDWYSIKFRDASRKEYLLDGKWMAARQEVEEIKIKGKETVYDTLIYTHFGPLTYTGNDTATGAPAADLALKWTALEASNELLTFYYMNRGRNYSDYLAALQYYQCPAQNFAFASHDDTIALWQQGKFPAKDFEQGKFIMDGSIGENDWKGYVAQEENPHTVNPERGFVSSANQHAFSPDQNAKLKTQTFANGIYEYYRNRRINSLLSEMDSITPQKMMTMQNDNFNLHAKEALPVLLKYMDKAGIKYKWEENIAMEKLRKWNYFNDTASYAPSVFEVWWKEINNLTWDELKSDTLYFANPHAIITTRLLNSDPENPFFDIQSTPEKENAQAIVVMAFRKAVDELFNNALLKFHIDPHWGRYKGTTAKHILRINAFSSLNIIVGGNHNVINATTSTHGPSWRMVAETGTKARGWGVYPGGQSGNPGSPFYDNFINTWRNGNYYELTLWRKDEIQDGEVFFRQEFLGSSSAKK